MTYKTHLTAGLLLSSVYFLEIESKHDLSFLIILVAIFATVVGSSAPDMDKPSGHLWRKIPAGTTLGKLMKPLFIGGHRHLSHSLIGLIIFPGILYLLLLLLLAGYPELINAGIIAFVIGYATHLFADLFTEEGIPLLFPLPFRFGIPPTPFDKARIKTGRWFENLIIYPALNLALLYVVLANLWRK